MFIKLIAVYKNVLLRIRNSESECALRADRASFPTIIKCDETMAGFRTRTDAGAANPNIWAATLSKITDKVEDGENSNDQIHHTSVAARFPSSMISREELKFFTQLKVMSFDLATLREDMSGLFEKSIYDGFITWHCVSQRALKIHPLCPLRA